MMQDELAKQYDPKSIERTIYDSWLEAAAFAAVVDERQSRYVVMMPLPNVTGALHMGHAMDNVMQDLLTRWHRMKGDNTLWQPGTDHAGIATQAIVEKRLFELEGKTRHDVGREALVERIFKWKDEYQERIIRQQQVMGCACDWDRARFTMDAVCARAVRWTFFNMFRDGLIYRGNRLVNWDCHLRTAVADDEIEHKKVQGHFWHLRYPVVDAKPGEPEHIVVATTRPETMLGDTAVACHPDPERALQATIDAAREKLQSSSAKDRTSIEEELARLEARRKTHLPLLLKLSEMARAGRQVLLPLQNRPIPLIVDEWAKPELGSGCVKITPGHDPNDYEVWKRHSEEIASINILNVDGTLNQNGGSYQGLDRFDARKRVVADLEAGGLLEAVEEREIEVGHSDRSKTPIEPYLSKQWFVQMGDVEGGVVFGRGTEKEFVAPGLAQAAMNAASGDWKSATDRSLSFHPDGERYRMTYHNWLAEKRDWCISRQLWWGHQIPIWWGNISIGDLPGVLTGLSPHLEREDVFARLVTADGESHVLEPGASPAVASGAEGNDEVEVLVCLRGDDSAEAVAPELEKLGLTRDPDVLDTWFSSGLWPHSTLGWPDPATAEVGPGQTRLGDDGGGSDSLDYYYPGSCLVTGRDIITLWVARMQVMGLYNLGDVPFTDCFLHANILDGKGERMSKSKGNGIDPADIIEQYGADAMRYVLCEMQTGVQDIRLPVQAVSPFTGELVDLATAKHGSSIFTYICPGSKKEFDVLGTLKNVPAASLVSDRFEVGRNFSNKLWNAARFALLNLEDVQFTPRQPDQLFPEDRWILSRLSKATANVERELERYNPAAAIGAAREFFWSEVCDWYVEWTKPRMRSTGEAPLARQVLATVLDQVLRLLHPFLPFITEALWEKLATHAPQRGVATPLPSSKLLIQAAWPQADTAWEDDELEGQFRFLQEVIRAIRDIRSKYNVAPTARVAARIRASGTPHGILEGLRPLLENLAGLESLEIADDMERAKEAAVQVVGDVQIYVDGVVDLEKEKVKLTKHRDQLLKRLEGARKKLTNENFLTRAKPEVVERERERVGELEVELQNVEVTLRDLEGG